MGEGGGLSQTLPWGGRPLCARPALLRAWIAFDAVEQARKHRVMFLGDDRWASLPSLPQDSTGRGLCQRSSGLWSYSGAKAKLERHRRCLHAGVDPVRECKQPYGLSRGPTTQARDVLQAVSVV